MQNQKKVKPDYNEFKELELHGNAKWYQLLTKFRSGELSIISITSIVILGSDKLDTATMLALAVMITLLGLVSEFKK